MPTDTSTLEPMCDAGWLAVAKAWLDVNADGVWDSNERPLQGIRFYLDVRKEQGQSVHREKAMRAVSDDSGVARLIGRGGCPKQVVWDVYPEVPASYNLTTISGMAGEGNIYPGGESGNLAGPFLFGFIHKLSVPTLTRPIGAEIRSPVGVVLPTEDHPRWLQDAAVFKMLGIYPLFSQGDSASEKAIVESLISQGVEVIIICPVDASAAAATVEEAHQVGVKVISYDRLIRDTDAIDYYVAFDDVAVGQAWGDYLVQQAGATKGNPLYLYAGAPSDNNAFLFFEGAWNKLQPKIADGTFIVKNSSKAVALKDKPNLTRDEMARIIKQVTTQWDPAAATNLAKADLKAATKADKGTVYIVAPNDSTARAIADVFAADKAVKKYYVTGQDAEKESVQYIIDDRQSMTVFKDVRTLAKDAITAANAFLAGGTPVQMTTYNNGKIDVPAEPSAIVTITKDNVRQALIDSGYYDGRDFTGLP
jgi:putative multiple sugar transport system substrate-binding protein